MKIINNPQNKNIQRLNEIYKVLKKNDFGHLIEENTFIKKFPLMKNENKKSQDLLDESLPIRIKKVLEELGPTYIKLGQMLSTRPDLVGIEIAEELEKLRDNTPTTSFNEIKKVIGSELGKPIDEIYCEIDETPIGSASIGQVYKAKLCKTNEKVAIKVQKPKAEETIKSDIKIMKFLAEKLDKYVYQTRTYNLPAIISEFERSIFKEIDYINELRNMEILSKNFRKIPYIHIPKTYDEYCTKKIITMELINGIEVSKFIEKDYPGYDKKLIAKYGAKSYFKQIMINGFFHADPHPGNMMITEDKKLCYIDEGMMGILDDDFRENLAELIILLINGNTDNIINQLVYMDIITVSQNTPNLKADINDLLNRYYGSNLKNINGGMQDLLKVMIKNNIILPREFVMIGRGIALIEETGRKLDPDFNTSSELKKLSKNIIKDKYKPGRLIKVSTNYLLQLEHLAKNLPNTINNTLSKIEEGNITVNLKHENIHNITNQLSISIILSAIIVGSSLAILADKGPRFMDIPVLGLVGFVISVALGIYIVIKFIRTE